MKTSCLFIWGKWQYHIAFGIVLISILGFSAPVAKAVISSDSLVVIAIDVTSQQGPCIETFHTNIGTSHEATTRFACPAGTIVQSKAVSLAQAQLLHEAYVLLPSNHVSPRIKLQIEQLLIEKKRELSRSSKTHIVHPLTSCDTESSASLRWNYNEYYSVITYYKLANPHCNEISLETASIKSSDIYPFNYLAWDHDQYAGGRFGVPNCPYVQGNGYYSHSVNQIFYAGYTYENWMYLSRCYGYTNYNDIGPLN